MCIFTIAKHVDKGIMKLDYMLWNRELTSIRQTRYSGDFILDNPKPRRISFLDKLRKFVEFLWLGIIKKGNRHMNGGSVMKLTENTVQDENLLLALDKGIEDMENGRELSIDDAFDLIAELVEKRRSART